ncbi:MAG: site-specific integrase [Bacteroidota bacterium]|nr:site-specific integrase [Bacteroidota bacterium]
MTTKVKLRQKPISAKRQSLYLDFYPPIPHPGTGKHTRREFLGLYLYDKIKTPIDKIHNKETLQLAEQIRQKRENLLNKPEIYTGYEKEQLRIHEKGEMNFVEYFRSLTNQRKASNHDNWVSAYKYLESFTNRNLKFVDLNEKVLTDFKEFLLTTKSTKSSKTTLSRNSAVSYFNKVKATLKQAYKDGYIPTDLNSKIEPIKQEEIQRNFLTIEELNQLVKTDCQNPIMKRAALFSALTGLRFSDIQKLLWSELEYIKGNGYFIQFKQQKTKGVEMMPISEQAFSLLGKRKEASAKVFEGLTYSAYHNKHLYQWIGAAGITKNITFHCFRHSYATLQLSNGTDIYTVSKMLGHRELKTTQVYAKIIDKTKREATDKIKLDF